jgi:DNA-directed RNA polymerase specialized sigma24 family protein
MGATEKKAGAGFPSTHWTKVYLASNLEHEGGSRALAELLRTYRPALRGYLRQRFSATREHADDWISAFVEQKILQQNLLKGADEAKGRFRNYLLTILYRFAEDQRRRENRVRRRPKGGWVPLEQHYRDPAEPPSNSHPNPGDLSWARTVLPEEQRPTIGPGSGKTPGRSFRRDSIAPCALETNGPRIVKWHGRTVSSRIAPSPTKSAWSRDGSEAPYERSSVSTKQLKRLWNARSAN